MPDSNKAPQNLSPDLKQIYDRVMNTPAKGGSVTPPPPSTPTSTPPPIATPTASPANPPQSVTVAPIVDNQPKPSAEINPTIPPQPPMQSVENEPFLTSAPPRPLQRSVGVKSFALGKEKKEDSKPAIAGTATEKKGMSKVLIGILIGIFFIAWTFFWVVFFFNPFA